MYNLKDEIDLLDELKGIDMYQLNLINDKTGRKQLNTWI